MNPTLPIEVRVELDTPRDATYRLWYVLPGDDDATVFATGVAPGDRHRAGPLPEGSRIGYDALLSGEPEARFRLRITASQGGEPLECAEVFWEGALDDTGAALLRGWLPLEPPGVTQSPLPWQEAVREPTVGGGPRLAVWKRMVRPLEGAAPATAEAQPPEPEPEPEPVLLGGSAPRAVAPGEEFSAHLAAYVASAEAEVRKILLDEGRPEDVRLGRKTGCRWKPGARVMVRLVAPDFRVVEPECTFEWDGAWLLAPFRVDVPVDAAPGRTVLDFQVFVLADTPEAGGVRVASLALGVEVTPAPGPREVQTATVSAAHTAFASYASEDRVDVLERVSSIRRSSGMDIFVDVVSLRMGEEWNPALEREVLSRDRLLLFWSEHAGASTWVQWEWEHFLRAKGMDGLELHLLEHVPAETIPEPLRHLHFDDVYLLARDAELYRRERARRGGG